MEADYPEILEDIGHRVARHLIERVKLDPATARSIGRDVAEEIRADWGGQHIYVPSGRAYEISERDMKIYERYRNGNYAELCREYKLSDRQLRRIVKRVGLYVREKRQLSMGFKEKPRQKGNK